MNLSTFRDREGDFVVVVEDRDFGMYARIGGAEVECIAKAAELFAMSHLSFERLAMPTSALEARNQVLVKRWPCAAWRKR